MSIDFQGIAARMLEHAEAYITSWFPNGKRRGTEWVVGSIRGEPGESFSINLRTGAWGEFADKAGKGTRGRDLISLLAAMKGISQAEAAKELEPEPVKPNGNGAHPPKTKTTRGNKPAIPAPIDHPPPPCFEGSPPEFVWSYFGTDPAVGPLFLVARYPNKQFRPLTWRGAEWRMQAWPAPRPLYCLPDLLAAPELPVLIVEGEKCAEAAQCALIDSYCVTTWPGGANAVEEIDFSPLYDRHVILWKDNDEAGNAAMAAIAGKLLGKAKSVAHLEIPDDKPPKWDCADAVADGVDLAAFIRAQVRIIEPAKPKNTARAVARANGKPINESAHSQWERLKLAKVDGGTPFATEDNVERIIIGHDNYRDRLYFDTFRMRKILVLNDGTEREWTDADTLATLIWIQSSLYIPKMRKTAVRDGIDAAANRNQRNSLTLWLRTLAWDGVPRLPTFMRDVFHADDTTYAADVGRCWLVSMIARAFNPGCQVDTMPVLEGGQGTYKSSALGILGGRYYAALPAAFGTRDFLQALDGMWLVEIPDMSGFKGRDIDHVKAIITTRVDRYCRRYAHDAETYPRQCVFAATANRDDWNEDETGARRFLPIKVGAQIELELLKKIRDQLFAEALQRYDKQEKWWDIEPTQARVEQAARRPDDSWEPAVRNCLEIIRVKAKIEEKPYVTVAQIFDELNFKMTDQGKAEQMRIARILLSLGWVRQTYWDCGKTRKRWLAPPTITTSESGGNGGGNDLFD